MLQNKDIPILDDEQFPEEAGATVADESEARSLASQLTGLIEDVRILAHAEVEYYRTKLSVNMVATKRVVTLFGVAVVSGITAIIALILGILLVLSEHFGPLAATAIVVGAALLIASIMMSMAIKQAKKLPLDENDS